MEISLLIKSEVWLEKTPIPNWFRISVSFARQTYLWDFPCQGLNGRASATSEPGDGEFDALPGRVQAHRELGLAPCVGDAV